MYVLCNVLMCACVLCVIVMSVSPFPGMSQLPMQSNMAKLFKTLKFVVFDKAWFVWNYKFKNGVLKRYECCNFVCVISF